MAKFYKNQQKMLKKFLDANPNRRFNSYEDLPTSFLEKYEAYRITETLWTDTERYMDDYYRAKGRA